MGKNFLVLGDAHMPWMSKRVFTKILDFLQQDGSKFDYVVQVGDLYDMFSHGRWARSYDLITPKQEMTEARLMAEEFWQILQSRCPKASHYQILGNHDARPMKKILEKAPEIAALLDIDHLWKFPGVNTVTDSREELILENIAFMHGFRSKLGDHAKYNQMCTVTGHSHRGGVVYFPVKNNLCWELNAGYLGDPEAVPLQYSQQKIINWTHGFGIIDDLGPRFCPL